MSDAPKPETPDDEIAAAVALPPEPVVPFALFDATDADDTDACTNVALDVIEPITMDQHEHTLEPK